MNRKDVSVPNVKHNNKDFINQLFMAAMMQHQRGDGSYGSSLSRNYDGW